MPQHISRNIILSAAFCVALGATSAIAAEARTVRAPTIGCFDRDILSRARDMRDDDGGAAREMVQEGLASGVCRRVAPGMLVRVDSDDILAGLSKVRGDGEPMAIWVRTDALSDD